MNYFYGVLELPAALSQSERVKQLHPVQVCPPRNPNSLGLAARDWLCLHCFLLAVTSGKFRNVKGDRLPSYLGFLSSERSLDFGQPGVGHVQLGGGICSRGRQSKGALWKHARVLSVKVTRSLPTRKNRQQLVPMRVKSFNPLLLLDFLVPECTLVTLPHSVASLSSGDKSRTTGVLRWHLKNQPDSPPTQSIHQPAGGHVRSVKRWVCGWSCTSCPAIRIHTRGFWLVSWRAESKVLPSVQYSISHAVCPYDSDWQALTAACVFSRRAIVTTRQKSVAPLYGI